MSKRKKIVVLTGAGISAESGIKTFRDAGGLWEGYDVMEVASPQGWRKDKETVLRFYNERRKQALTTKPNPGHLTLAQMQNQYDVSIITQNIDNLHEKAGSEKVIHLHGELFKSQSTVDSSLVYDMDGWELNIGDKCEKGSQLRPFVVWFGEMVPMMEVAALETYKADIFMVVGTSLAVYPAAGLLDLVPDEVPKFIIDPNLPTVNRKENMHLLNEPASTGVPKAFEIIKEKYSD